MAPSSLLSLLSLLSTDTPGSVQMLQPCDFISKVSSKDWTQVPAQSRTYFVVDSAKVNPQFVTCAAAVELR
jgi:hypothetical protein